LIFSPLRSEKISLKEIKNKSPSQFWKILQKLKSAVSSLYQKESRIFSKFLSELFEKKPSGNKPFRTLLTETLTLESESGYPVRFLNFRAIAKLNEGGRI